jgi:hypothetical protein
VAVAVVYLRQHLETMPEQVVGLVAVEAHIVEPLVPEILLLDQVMVGMVRHLLQVKVAMVEQEQQVPI